MAQAFWKKGGAGEGGKGRAFGLLVRSLTDRLTKRWIKKKEKKTFAGQIFPTWSALIAILPQGKNLNIRMGSNKSLYNIIQPWQTAAQPANQKVSAAVAGKRASSSAEPSKFSAYRRFSYYHWLCCHMLTGFRRPQQDPCLGWYEFCISFLLCNLNSRDEFAVLECVKGQKDSPSPCTVRDAYSRMTGIHVFSFIHMPCPPFTLTFIPKEFSSFLFTSPTLTTWTSEIEKRRKIIVDQIETLQPYVCLLKKNVIVPLQ